MNQVMLMEIVQLRRNSAEMHHCGPALHTACTLGLRTTPACNRRAKQAPCVASAPVYSYASDRAICGTRGRRLNNSGLFSPSQTNTGLYIQLHVNGFSTDDILRVQDAYLLCCLMFNGRYRKTGRPFICHAVGAASSVAHFDRDVTNVLAAMFHAAYDSGDFPDGKSSKRTAAHKAWLAQHLGAEVEELVARLSALALDTGDPERLVAGKIAEQDEVPLFLALAHEIDDLADGGLAFAPKYGKSVASRVTACAGLARRLGREELASMFESYGEAYKELDWTEQLRKPSELGFRIAPNLRTYIKLRRAERRGQRVMINR